MNELHQLIKVKLKLQDNAVIFGPESEWSEFSSVIRESLKIIRPDAVYHFNKQPFILFFDFTKPENRERENIIHRRVWCFDKAPVVFFVFEDEVQIYNAFRYQQEHDTLEKLNVSDYEQQFSFWRLQSGNTWQWLQDTFHYKNIKKDRVDQKLFDNIKETRKKLTEDITPPLEDTFANTLILRLIFIRYLIDRGVEIDERFITGNTPAEKKQHLNQIIGDRVELNNFFSYLEERFNGNLFETDKDPDIAQTHLIELSRIFSAHKDQLFLFDIFDFSIIPVETISGIYESVIHPEKRASNSAIYTPSFIVDYILAQTVNDDYLEENNECRILDPACGSGIFLVQAYRKIVEWTRSKKGVISDERLVQLIQQCLFGIDKDRNALNITAFSLYVALLDYKNPPEIKKFKLPRLLDTNLFEADFLDEEASFNAKDVFQNKEFDFILGNPPWGSKKYKKHLDYIHKYELPIADIQIAQTFLARTKDFSNLYTKCSLIVTSSSFHSITAKKFKEYFLENFHIKQIFDLSAVRRLIFPEKKNPALVLFYGYAFEEDTEENVIEYLSLKQNIFLKYFNTLVIERQDRKRILQKYFIDYAWMFKVALYGNTIDFYFLKRLSHYSTINDRIDNVSKIFKGNGILKSPPKPEPFLFLEGLPNVKTEEISLFYTTVNENTPTLKKKDTFVAKGRKPELFQGNHILLKRRTMQESQPVISYIDTSCAFWNSVYSITSKECIEELKKIYGMLISDLSTYFQYITSSNWGVATRPEISLDEYLSFPYGNIQDEDQFITLVDEFIESVRSTPRFSKQLLQKINQAIFASYGVSDIEQDLIDYVLNVSRYQFQENKLDELIRKTSEKNLHQYAQVFYDHFSHIYNEDNEYFQIEVYRLPYFVAMTFNIVEVPPAPENGIAFPKHNHTEQDLLKTIAQTVSINELSERIFSQKDVKGFEEDFFYIIKPDEYKCWHRAMAHYDLAEFVEALEKAELEELTRI